MDTRLLLPPYSNTGVSKQRGVTIPLYSSRCDWITITSYDPAVFGFFRKMLDGFHAEEAPCKVMQYSGFEKTSSYGTMRVVKGAQRGMEHCLVYFTSSLADIAFDSILPVIKNNEVNIPRIDIQTTIESPKNLNMFNALVRMKRAGHRVSWNESSHKKYGSLETIGIGSRSSDRFRRLYTKESDKRLLFRYEAEYKGDRAMAVTNSIIDQIPMSEILNDDIHRLKDRMTKKWFYGKGGESGSYRVKVKKMSPDEKTASWLINDVAPVLDRILTTADERKMVLGHFARIVRGHSMIGIDTKIVRSTKDDTNV